MQVTQAQAAEAVNRGGCRSRPFTILIVEYGLLKETSKPFRIYL